jgi:hypothetical protein
MRIRSVKPEFFTSEDIAALDWNTRLVFIGIWAYVDDNGVGRDVEKLIAADLFPLEDDPHAVRMQIACSLQRLSEAGLIVRYTYKDRPFLEVTGWDKHQYIARPNKKRYEPSTSENAVIRHHDGTMHANDMQSAANVVPGTEEQRNRGTGDKNTSSPQAATEIATRPNLELVIDAEPEPAPRPAGYSPAFEEWWKIYPRNESKGAAAKAYTNARKIASQSVLLEAVQAYVTDPNLPELTYVPYAQKWLNERKWEDGPLPVRRNGGRPVAGPVHANGTPLTSGELKFAQAEARKERPNPQVLAAAGIDLTEQQRHNLGMAPTGTPAIEAEPEVPSWMFPTIESA